MKKVIFFILFTIVSIPTLSACWDTREVNDLAIAVALGIDKSEDKGYTVSVQILNPSEVASQTAGGGSGYDTPVTTYTSSGKILFEAIRKLTQQTPRKLYLAHLRIIVIGEEVAKEGIYNAIDFLSRDPELRTDFYIIVSKDSKAEDVLRILTNIEKLPANKLYESLEASSDAWAVTGKVNLNDLLNDIVSEGKQPVLTGIKIKGDPKIGTSPDNVQSIYPKAELVYDGMAAFRNNKLVGWLDEEESKGLNYVKGTVKSTLIVTDMNDGQVGIELIKSSAEIIPHFGVGSTPTIEVKITGEANIGEVNTNLDLLKDHVFSELEKKTNEKIKDNITSAIEKAQKEYKADIFGFGDKIHKEDPKKWEEIKTNWTEIFPTIQVEVKVDIKIRRTGTITNPFHNELSEE